MKRSSNLNLKLELLPGTHIEEAIDEMLDKAKVWHINVEASFNDVMLFVCPHSDKKKLIAQYQKDIHESKGD